MIEYAGFKEETLKEILKGNEDEPLSKKTNLISDWCKKQEENKDKDKEKAKDKDKEKKEDDKGEDEEEKIPSSSPKRVKKTTEIAKPTVSKTDKETASEIVKEKDEDEEDYKDKEGFDPDDIFGLEKNENFTKVFESVKKYGSTNYNDDQNKNKKQRGALFKSAYDINSDNVEGEYANAMSNYYTSM